jgi:hypothetical protein
VNTTHWHLKPGMPSLKGVTWPACVL